MPPQVDRLAALAGACPGLEAPSRLPLPRLSPLGPDVPPASLGAAPAQVAVPSSAPRTAPCLGVGERRRPQVRRGRGSDPPACPELPGATPEEQVSGPSSLQWPGGWVERERGGGGWSWRAAAPGTLLRVGSPQLPPLGVPLSQQPPLLVVAAERLSRPAAALGGTWSVPAATCQEPEDAPRASCARVPGENQGTGRNGRQRSRRPARSHAWSAGGEPIPVLAPSSPGAARWARESRSPQAGLCSARRGSRPPSWLPRGVSCPRDRQREASLAMGLREAPSRNSSPAWTEEPPGGFLGHAAAQSGDWSASAVRSARGSPKRRSVRPPTSGAKKRPFCGALQERRQPGGASRQAGARPAACRSRSGSDLGAPPTRGQPIYVLRPNATELRG